MGSILITGCNCGIGLELAKVFAEMSWRVFATCRNPEKADELLTEMQSQRFHMAVVVDEYGGVAGLVTLEDIV